MITVTRRQARRLRGVFRRHSLGIAHRGPVPPLVFLAGPNAGLRIRHHQAAPAVGHVLPGSNGTEEAMALPLDTLADFDGRDDTTVVLEAVSPGRTVARWVDRGIPQSKEYTAPDPAGLPPFPEPPDAFETCPGDLLDAIAEAAATTDEGSTRYALDCLQRKGATGELVATDGRQVLIQGGFRFPWDGDLLVRRTPLFAGRSLPRDRPVGVGRTDAHVAVRAGDWTVWMAIRADGRFPRVEHAIPAAHGPATRLRLATQDAAFLGNALDRLPGGDAPNAPVTLDLNGRVAVRARGDDAGRVTEVVLGRSVYAGDPVRLSTSRHFLARAVRLGFAEVQVTGPDDPVSCRDGRRVYAWQPLSKDSAVGPADDAVCIESAAAVPAVRETPNPKEDDPVSESDPQSRPPASSGRDGRPEEGAVGLASLIREAAALHDALADAKSRARRLVAALRRHRQQERRTLVALAAFRQLKLHDVAAG